MLSWNKFFPVLPDHYLSSIRTCSHNKASFIKGQAADCWDSLPNVPNIDELMSGYIKAGNNPIISANQDGLFNLTQDGEGFIIPCSHSNNRIDPLRLDVLGATCFSQDDFYYISIHGTYQNTSLVIVKAHNIAAQNLEGQLTQLNGAATFKQVFIPNEYLPFHRGQSNSLKALGNSCDFTLVVSKDTNELL